MKAEIQVKHLCCSLPNTVAFRCMLGCAQRWLSQPLWKPCNQYCPVQILHARSARVSHAKTEVSGGRFSRLVDIFRVPRSKFSGIHLGGEATLYPPTLSKSLEIPAGNGQELPRKICAGHYCPRIRARPHFLANTTRAAVAFIPMQSLAATRSSVPGSAAGHSRGPSREHGPPPATGRCGL